MRRMILAAILLGLVQSTFADRKPREVIADDVQCTDCVNQEDIGDGAVGEAQLTQILMDRIAALEADLAAQPKPVQVFSDGTSIGKFISLHVSNQKRYTVISNQGYLFSTRFTAVGIEWYHQVGRLYQSVSPYFDQSGCSGQALLQISSPGTLDEGIGVGTGHIVRSSIEHSAVPRYFVPKNEIPASWLVMSILTPGSGCSELTPVFREAVRIFPNDPAITGVQDEPFSAPITLGR